jgi:hypothetical protein
VHALLLLARCKQRRQQQQRVDSSEVAWESRARSIGRGSLRWLSMNIIV